MKSLIRSQKGMLHLSTLLPLLLVVVAIGGIGAYVLQKSNAGKPSAGTTVQQAEVLMHRMASDMSGQMVYLLDPTTKTTRDLSFINGKSALAKFNSSGTKIAFADPDNQCQVFVVNTDGSNKYAVSSTFGITGLAWAPNDIDILASRSVRPDGTFVGGCKDWRMGAAETQYTAEVYSMSTSKKTASLIYSAKNDASNTYNASAITSKSKSYIHKTAFNSETYQSTTSSLLNIGFSRKGTVVSQGASLQNKDISVESAYFDGRLFGNRYLDNGCIINLINTTDGTVQELPVIQNDSTCYVVASPSQPQFAGLGLDRTTNRESLVIRDTTKILTSIPLDTNAYYLVLDWRGTAK